MKLAFNLVFNHSLLSSVSVCLWETAVPQAAFFSLEWTCRGHRAERGIWIALFQAHLSDSSLDQKKKIITSALELSKFIPNQINPQLSCQQYSPLGQSMGEQCVSWSGVRGAQKYYLHFTVWMCSFWDVGNSMWAGYSNYLLVLLLPKHPSKGFLN